MSLYDFCNGDPVNYFDADGRLQKRFDKLDTDGDGRVYVNEDIPQDLRQYYNILSSTDPNRVILPPGAGGYEQVYNGALLASEMVGRDPAEIHRQAYKIMRKGLGAFGGGATWNGAEPIMPSAPRIISEPFQGKPVQAAENAAPIWSKGPKGLAPEGNAAAHAAKHGAEFPELAAGEYVSAAQKFVAKPPAGALTKVRPNGDTLIYDQATNTFAVRTADGAPRTMFRPSDGVKYWEKQ